MPRKRSIPKTQVSLANFKEESNLNDLTKLTKNQISILQAVDEGAYGAAIARDMHLSRSYISRQIKDFREKGIIEQEWVNPLQGRAVSYRLSKQTKNFLVHIKETNSRVQNFSLHTPHRIRYKFSMVGKTKAISENTKRFAAAKLKNTKTFCNRSGVHYVFEMNHDYAGKIGILTHQNSVEVYQIDRRCLPGQSVEDVDQKMAMAINEAAQRFVQEQSWENVHFTLGDPVQVGSAHYAMKSRLGRSLTNDGQTQLQFSHGYEVDKSLEDKYKDPDYAEIECRDRDIAELVDVGLRNAADIHNIVPKLVRDELKSVADQITGITELKDKVDATANNVHALCQSGLPLQNLYNQLSAVVSGQQSQITTMQNTLLKVVENMGKILDKMELNRG